MTSEYSLCRTCGTRAPKENMESIFNSQDVANKFKSLLSLNLVLDRRLPEFMCRPCVMELNLTHDFIQKALGMQKQQLDIIFSTEKVETAPVPEQIPQVVEAVQASATSSVPTPPPKSGDTSPEVFMIDDDSQEPPPSPPKPPSPIPRMQLKLKPISTLMRQDTPPRPVQPTQKVQSTVTTTNLKICEKCWEMFSLNDEDFNLHKSKCAGKGTANTQVVKPMQLQQQRNTAIDRNAAVQNVQRTPTYQSLLPKSVVAVGPQTSQKFPLFRNVPPNYSVAVQSLQNNTATTFSGSPVRFLSTTVPQMMINNSNQQVATFTTNQFLIHPVSSIPSIITSSQIVTSTSSGRTESSTGVERSQRMPVSNYLSSSQSRPIQPDVIPVEKQATQNLDMPMVVSTFSLAQPATVIANQPVPPNPNTYTLPSVSSEALLSLEAQPSLSAPPQVALQSVPPSQQNHLFSPELTSLLQNRPVQVSQSLNVKALLSLLNNPDLNMCSLFDDTKKSEALFEECLNYICLCSTCRIFFLNRAEYNLHLAKTSNNQFMHKFYPCSVCKLNFASARLLKEHHNMALHGNVREQFTCSLCPLFSSKEENVTKHMLKMHCFCPHCHTNLLELRSKLLAKKQICQLESRKCQICGLVINKHSELAMLLCKKTCESVCICNLCSVAVGSKQQLTEHFRKCHPQVVDGYFCPFEAPQFSPKFSDYKSTNPPKWDYRPSSSSDQKNEANSPEKKGDNPQTEGIPQIRPAPISPTHRSSSSSLGSSESEPPEEGGIQIKQESADAIEEIQLADEMQKIQYCCLDCPASFSQFGDLMEHTKKSHQVSFIKCDKCHRNFANSGELCSHTCGINLARQNKSMTLQLVKIEDMLE